MSDDLKRTIDGLKGSLRGVYERMDKLEDLQRKTAELAVATADQTSDVKRHFETFLVRFEEAMEMLVRHDTEQLQRTSTVERQYDELRSRVEALEKKAG